MKDPYKTVPLETMIDQHIGERGTKAREAFEQELNNDLLGQAVRQARKERNLSRAELGIMAGVNKSQISKIENGIKDARLETILKVFRALDAKVHFSIEMDQKEFTY